jgi:hypothetical protein
MFTLRAASRSLFGNPLLRSDRRGTRSSQSGSLAGPYPLVLVVGTAGGANRECLQAPAKRIPAAPHIVTFDGGGASPGVSYRGALLRCSGQGMGHGVANGVASIRGEVAT